MIINKRISKQKKRKNPFVTYYYPESALADQFQMIQTNINFLMSEKMTQTLMITSPDEGDGKSILLANIAVSMAQQKKKVLVIDTNLRTPALHDFFHTTNSSGLTDVLTGRMSFNEAVYHTEIWRLDLLASGSIPINPFELLGSSMMKDLLIKVKESYDVILLDSTALLKLPDTKLLASLCDGVLLVVKNGKTKLQSATEAKKMIEFSKAKLIGVILNQ
ncbi:CpsD/CapB family tyrosine-protein kinase [Neobacillus drentensis]|uniref:CpsD/CapB family tyrosine-protein kinase n=1 Tax=Neobacillus drentensis TaxID=220684 RepID=UPI002FFF0289